MLAGGAHGLATDQARRLRAAVADDLAGDALVRVLDDLVRAGFAVEGERLKRVPPELREAVPEDSPRHGLLTRKTLFAVLSLEPGPWLHEPGALDVVADAWRRLAPLNDWLARHVGPTRAERAPRP
jgi:Conserved hypothetical protein (DUF2461)